MHWLCNLFVARSFLKGSRRVSIYVDEITVFFYCCSGVLVKSLSPLPYPLKLHLEDGLIYQAFQSFLIKALYLRRRFVIYEKTPSKVFQRYFYYGKPPLCVLYLSTYIIIYNTHATCLQKIKFILSFNIIISILEKSDLSPFFSKSFNCYWNISIVLIILVLRIIKNNLLVSSAVDVALSSSITAIHSNFLLIKN